MQKVTEISQPHNQNASFSNEYFPYCRKINIDLNEFLHSLAAKNKNYEIQIEYFTEIHAIIPNTIQHIPLYPIHHVQKLNSHK